MQSLSVLVQLLAVAIFECAIFIQRRHTQMAFTLRADEHLP